ncbi:MAG TPA: DNA-binding protein [Acidobacteriaceae bacterium]|jgi:hypothetical protein|nr:DNA-binding protein [Acidobacteriaceae bacterium]
MPEKVTRERAEEDLREGKAPSTAAGEFVKEEIDHVREGKHGARSPKQAIAIGLSKARRAGIPLKPPSGKNQSPMVRRKAEQDYERGQSGAKKTSRKRSAAREQVMEKEPRSTASHRALSKQTKSAARKRSASSRHAAAKKAVKTRTGRPSGRASRKS